jgi:hypothetical protein
MTTILDPTDERVPVERQLAARKNNVTGVVGLLDISKPRGDVFLDQVEDRLQELLPDVELRRYAKPTFTKPCPDDLRLKIRSECDFVVEALAD